MESATYATTPAFTFEGLKTAAKVVRIYDGDTCYVVIEHFGSLIKLMCRLDGIDAPEIRTTPQAALLARNRLAQLSTNVHIDLECTSSNIQGLLDKNTKILTAEFFGKEKYGRELASLYDNGVCINDVLVSEGYCKAYDGGSKD